MAGCVGMLRLGRRVLGTRTVLSRGWQEARLQGVRPLRYGDPGRERAGQPPGGSRRAWLGDQSTQAGRPAAAAPLDGPRGRGFWGEAVTPHQHIGNRKCWPSRRRLELGGGWQ